MNIPNECSPEFINLVSRAVDEMIKYVLKNNPDKQFGYIVMTLEDGMVAKLSTCSNLPPDLMYELIRMVALSSHYKDVTAETTTH